MLPRPFHAGRIYARDEDGASAVAIVGSILITMLLAILQLGWALQIRSDMARAADQAVRYVMLKPEADDTEFEAEVSKALANYDEDRLVVAAGETTVGTSNFRTAKVDYDLPVAIPGFPKSLVTLSISRRTPLLPPT